MKSQNVRLLDVFLIGPLMIYGGHRSTLNDPLKSLLIAAGVATIIYNGNNYIRLK